MQRLCAFDIETDRNSEALISGGWAVDTVGSDQREQGVCDAKHEDDLIEQLDLADTIVGHNIIDFDLPLLLKRFPATMQAAVAQKNFIDTLYLSPVAFPRNPYHHLYKDYKPYPLSQNKPEEDAIAARRLLDDEERALADLPGEARSVLLTLLGRCPKTSAFTTRLARDFERLDQRSKAGIRASRLPTPMVCVADRSMTNSRAEQH